MGNPRLVFRRAVVAVTSAALLLSATVVSSSVPAEAAEPAPVSGKALPTAQVNGVVWTQAVSKGVDYVGGSFNQSQPAGAAKGANVTARSNLFAYDVATGAAVPSFNPTANAQVRGIAASADGTRIYIVGDFTVVNGQPRHHVAALTPGGRLLPFAPNVNGKVYSVALHGSTVFLGGTFTAVNGAARTRAAAVSGSGALLPFSPKVANYAVRAIAVAADGSKVLLGGNFTKVNGATANGLAAVLPSSGRSMHWAANQLIYNHGENSAIYSLAARGDAVYATGYVLGKKSDGNLEGAVAMRWSDGSVIWVEDCHGDSYSVAPFNGAVYVATHAHFCGNIGGFGQTTPVTYHRALAFTQAATRKVAHNKLRPDYYFDFGGEPGPSLLNWSPELQAGNYTGMNQAAWSVAAGGSYVVFGGEFTHVNGVRQTGLVRFLGRPEAPDPGLSAPVKDPGTKVVPGRVSTPNAVALGPSKLAVKWTAPRARAAAPVTSYVVKVYKGSRLVHSLTVRASKRIAVVGALTRSTAYRVGVAAKSAHGTGRLSVLDPVKTTAKGKNVSATKKPAKMNKPSTTKGKTLLRVRWKHPSTAGALEVTSYEVRVTRGGKVMKVVVGSGSRTKQITGLKRHALYEVSVRARNWAGWSSWSHTRSARTR